MTSREGHSEFTPQTLSFPCILTQHWPVEIQCEPWLVQFSGWSTGLETKGSLVPLPVRAHAWVAGQVPRRGCMGDNHTLMFLSLFLPSFPSVYKRNKIVKRKREIQCGPHMQFKIL